MVTLNQSLHRTSHYSLLMRKSAKLGFYEVKELIQLAAQRGCSHYSNVLDNGEVKDPGQDQLSDNELVILLLHGNNQYEPIFSDLEKNIIFIAFILQFVIFIIIQFFEITSVHREINKKGKI